MLLYSVQTSSTAKLHDGTKGRMESSFNKLNTNEQHLKINEREKNFLNRNYFELLVLLKSYLITMGTGFMITTEASHQGAIKMFYSPL